MDPKIRQLRAFALAYRLGSVTRAAQGMNVTQSAASQLVHQLEDVLGVKLFQRESGALKPTAAADAALATVEDILAKVNVLKQQVRQTASAPARKVVFACTPSFASIVMPRVFEVFIKSNPGVQATLRDVSPEKILPMVESGEVEFGLATDIHPSSEAEFTQLRKDVLCAVFASAAGIPASRQMRWTDLAQHRIIGLEGGSGLPRVIQAILEQQGVAYQPAYDFAYLHTALAMAANGLGVVLLPSYLSKAFPSRHKLVARKLVEPVVPRGLYLVTRKDVGLSPAAAAFTRALAEAL